MDNQQLLRYSRHITLPQIDASGQQCILDARVLVVGCGGLGNTAVPFLAAAGIGRMGIADPGRVELPDLQSQIQYGERDLGALKAQVLARRVLEQNGSVQVEVMPALLNQEEMMSLVREYDVLLDCTDNPAGRQMINRAAVAAGKPMVSGSTSGFEGHLTAYDPSRPESPCYACLYGEEETGRDNSLSAVFSPLAGVIGALQAAETLKIVTGVGRPSLGRLLNYDSLQARLYVVNFARNPHCRVCGNNRYS